MRIALVLAWATLQSGQSPGLTESQAISITTLRTDTHHVQGIDTDGALLWVTSVDRVSRKGFLQEFSLANGQLLRSAELQDGPRFHPGGFAADDEWLWIPVAEYRRNSTAVVQKRSKKTLAMVARFPVDDHIGCLAHTGNALVGGNWDSRDFYVWDLAGKLIRKVPSATANGYQDLKFDNGRLVAAGLLANRSGAIDWLEFPSFKLIRRVDAGATSRGVALTHEGMAIRDGKLYLLPEDTPSRLYTFNVQPSNVQP